MQNQANYEMGGGIREHSRMELIFRDGGVYSCALSAASPEEKERAFQDQWIKLVFIGSKLERPREQSCGRFTLFRGKRAPMA
ncbi:hypothetical protein C1I88_10540 [Akkermansia muciniphila]|nr:hypothetical protein C1I88_10540 [Akkermansia muciniphila]